MARTNTNVNTGITAITADSVQGDGSLGNPIELVNDQAVPPVSNYYGTDGLGTLGYHPLLSPAGLISDTYININTLILGSLLNPGGFYEINDYQTIAVVPGNAAGDTVFGTQEPLILQAASTNTFYKNAISTTHPEDIIYYDFIDSTSANPGVLIPNGNMGRISYRECTTEGENRSTPYDFRECKFYHPLSSYDFTGIPFPIVLNSIVIQGLTSFLNITPRANLDEVVDYLRDPSEQLFNISSHVALANTITVFSLYNENNGYSGTWGNLTITDQIGVGHVLTPTTQLSNNYYTFGNRLQTFGGSYLPAGNGNLPARNVHVGACSDGWSGTVLNNIIFGQSVIDFHSGVECINGFVGDGCWDTSIGDDCYYGFVFPESSMGVTVGKRNGYTQAQLVLSYGDQDIEIGDFNEYDIYLPKNAVGWTIGEGMSKTGSINLTSVVTLSNRVLRKGYSNMDKDVIYSGSSHSITVLDWVGIANVVGTNLTGTDRLDTITAGRFPTKFPFKVMPKLSYFTFAVGNTLVAGDKITGTLTGATGQIVRTYTPVSGSIQYIIETWTGSFVTETTVTAGIHTGTVATFSSNESLTLDPTFCDPSLIPIASLGNIKLNAGSPVMFLDGKKGDYMIFNNDNADVANIYQLNVGNFL